MKILLIYPYFLDARLNAEDIQSPPMGIYDVAAVLKEHGHAVEVLNWHDRAIAPETITAALREKAPQVIGFSILHANRWGGIEIARVAKRIDPGITVVFGGVGATHLWEHFLTHFPEIDFIVMGEGEHPVLRLVAALEGNALVDPQEIPGLAFRKNGRPFRTAPAEAVCDLDALPMPGRHFDLAHVSLTRGCVSNCAFCGSPAFWGRRVRSHSADYFVEHLAVMSSRGRRFFYVSDDTFTLDRCRAIDVCRQIVQRRLDIHWAAISRVDAVDEEVLAWMRRAGCIQISDGVESGSTAIRRRLNKRIRESRVLRAFELTQRYGIMARAYFIYGCPGETRATIQETIDLMLRIKPLGAIFYILDLFPGTALYADMKRRLNCTDDTWLKRVEDIMYFETDPALSQEQVLEYGRILREAYWQGLPGFVQALAPTDDPEFAPLHADFFSRLAMTFDQGDFARVEAIPDKPRLAEDLYRRALGYHPDARAYLGLGILNQKAGRYPDSADILTSGLSHFPDDEHLSICLAVSLMNLERFRQALELLKRRRNSPRAKQLAAACRQAMT
ncbi:MAG: radical SAM protein [Syntrophobacterales bacterium]|nr:MAG: radical SAM protein [Syntrophobacterales bacterium]